MTVLNNEVAGIFSRMADLLEIESGNVYRIRAYRNAAPLLKHVMGKGKRFRDPGPLEASRERFAENAEQM